MTNERKITSLLLALTGFCLLMEITRIYRSMSISHSFLFWNLLLAWIPYILSIQFQRYYTEQRRPSWLITLFLWIIFLPNGPYIITDLIHLRLREPIPMWFDVMLISTLAWNGLLLALLSVRYIHEKLSQDYSEKKLIIPLLISFISSGYGIYLGRFMRWNSWDIFFSPFYIVHHSLLELIHPFHHPRPLLVTAAMAIILSLSYAILYIISHKPNLTNETI